MNGKDGPISSSVARCAALLVAGGCAAMAPPPPPPRVEIDVRQNTNAVLLASDGVGLAAHAMTGARRVRDGESEATARPRGALRLRGFARSVPAARWIPPEDREEGQSGDPDAEFEDVPPTTPIAEPMAWSTMWQTRRLIVRQRSRVRFRMTSSATVRLGGGSARYRVNAWIGPMPSYETEKLGAAEDAHYRFVAADSGEGYAVTRADADAGRAEEGEAFTPDAPDFGPEITLDRGQYFLTLELNLGCSGPGENSIRVQAEYALRVLE